MRGGGEGLAIRSLGVGSDFAVMAGLSVFEVHSDRIVQRTPSEPDFWFGNMTVFREVGDLAAQAAIAEADCADADHCCIGWDDPALAPDDRFAALETLGFEVEATDVLVHPALPIAPPAEGLSARALTSGGDFAQAQALDHAEGVREGYPAESHLAFLRRRFGARRRQIAEGRAAWFGAFDGAVLAGCLGIVLGPGVARYQSVGTAPEYRRRGAASALVAAAAGWAKSRAPETAPVIVADAGSDAGRLYRRLGFVAAERQVTAMRPGY